MFDKEKLLLQTPRFTVMVMMACLILHILVHLGYINGISIGLNVFEIAEDPWQAYQLFTSPFVLEGGKWKGPILMLAGLHVGSWFVIAANKSRW